MSRNDNGRVDLGTSDSQARLILSRLEGTRQTGPSRWIARCPGPRHEHGDRHPSLSIGETSDGAALIHCFAGCCPTDVLSALGLTLADLFPPRLNDPSRVHGGKRRVPPIPWRDVFEALELDLTAASLAFRDLAAGKVFTPEDAKLLAKFCEDLEYQLRRARNGR